jgi:uncharacterized membrane protein
MVILTFYQPLASLSVRIPLGFLLVLFLPGYVLIAALFPMKNDMSGLERVMFSLGFSLVVTPMIGLGLNYTARGIEQNSVVSSLAVFILAFALIGWIRRNMLPPKDRFSVGFLKGARELMGGLKLRRHLGINKAIIVLFVLAIIASISTTAYIFLNPKQEEGFTEFYVLGIDGMADDYPTSVGVGNISTVTVGVVNHENRMMSYLLRVASVNSMLLEREIELNNGHTWEDKISYMLRDSGAHQKLRFLLYKDGNFTFPYRELYLWINITGPNSSIP